MNHANGLSRPALLVIDVQNYFFDVNSPAFLTAGVEILPKIDELIRLAIRSGWLVVSTSHGAPSREGNLMEKKWRRLPRGSECFLYPGLTFPKDAHHIPKEHYSAFFETPLEETLSEHRIDTVIICGVMTHLCVDTTARHAFMLGWEPIIVADACCSKTSAYHEAALSALAHGFARIVTTQDLLGTDNGNA